MFRTSIKHYSPIAIDIGAANLHAIQLDRRGGKLAVQSWCELPVAAEPEGKTAGQAPLSPASWPIIDRARFTGSEVVISLNPPDVECAPLRVPENLLKMDHRALLAAIRHEVSRSISQPIDGAEIDAWPLVPGHLDSPNLMIAAARRDLIGSILAWLERQHLICRRIDVGPLSALRACARLAHLPSGDQLWGVLDIGKAAVRLYIGIGEVPVYVRCVPRGGEEMTRRISEELGVDRAVAEAYKRHYGMQSTDGHRRSAAAIDDAVDSRRMAGILLSVLRPTIRSIGEEIQRSFRYAMGLYPDRTIAGLWTIGGGSELAGLQDSLHELLGVAVHKVGGTPSSGEWVNPAGWPEQMVTRSMSCLGSCLGEMN